MIMHGSGLIVWLGVSDLEKSCDFYADTLGLELRHLDHNEGWAEFAHPHCAARLLLRLTDKDEISPAGGATVVFDVLDIRQAMEQLQGGGVPFLTEVINHNSHLYATFIDPDGNHLQLRQVAE